jgi:hypothetical protein
MALSKLSGDEQGIILGQLCNPLDRAAPRHVLQLQRQQRAAGASDAGDAAAAEG